MNLCDKYFIDIYNARTQSLSDADKANEIANYINSISENLNDNDKTYRFKTIIPIYEEDGSLEKYMILYDVKENFNYEIEIIDENELTSYIYTLSDIELKMVLSSNKINLHNNEYLINDKIFKINQETFQTKLVLKIK